ncbi:MAG: 8-oxo-dGTP diphosphatase [Lachnospiraceae bacterium]|nr:8-oxo-dGTP diphosphatase [Lachnospiraceae bacterium]
MTETTLCYLEKDGAYLMLHRIKKKNDINEGKWIGVGGKLEGRESPEEGAKREIFEETGLTAERLKLRAVITFLSEQDDERMYLFTCDQFSGVLKECDEGVLEYIDKKKVYELPSWEGDKIFLEKIADPEQPFFSLLLEYERDRLLRAELYEDGIFRKLL